MDIHTRQGKYAASRTYPQSLPTTLGIEGAASSKRSAPASRTSGRVTASPIACAGAATRTTPWSRLGGSRRYPTRSPGGRGRGDVPWLDGALSGKRPRSLRPRGHGPRPFGVRRIGSCWSRWARGLAPRSTRPRAARRRPRSPSPRARRLPSCTTRGSSRTASARRPGAWRRRGVRRRRCTDPARQLPRDAQEGPRGQLRERRRQRPDLDPIELGEAGSLFLTRPRLADHLDDAPTIRRRAAEIFEALLDGSLAIEIAGRYAFDDIERAHEALEHRRSVGKPLLKIAD